MTWPLINLSLTTRKVWLVAGLLAVIVIPAAVLFRFAPEQYPFYPRCMFYTVTGWQCPGCGGLRATHQLLHGHVAAAFELNPLVFIFLPLIGFLFALYLFRVVTGRSLLDPFRNRLWVWVLLGIMVGFGVVRNSAGQ